MLILEYYLHWLQILNLDMQALKRFNPSLGVFFGLYAPLVQTSVFVHRATRQTHNPTMKDWKISKRVVRYLKGKKTLKLYIDRRANQLYDQDKKLERHRFHRGQI